MADAREVVLEEWVLRLDGNVVEMMHRTGINHRFHVKHVAVEAKPSDRGIALRVGIDVKGTIVDGSKLEVPTANQAEVEALFAEARKRRDSLSG